MTLTIPDRLFCHACNAWISRDTGCPHREPEPPSDYGFGKDHGAEKYGLPKTMIEKVAQAIDDTGSCTCRDCLRLRARAAIEAMREPTKEMWAAMDKPETKDEVLIEWRAMIDAALKEQV